MIPEADRRRRLPNAPLAPAAWALAAGIVADRYSPTWGTRSWLALAMAAAMVALVGVRWDRLSRWGLVVALFALGAARHHVAWSDLAPDDLAHGRWEAPRPAWVRGVLIENPEYRPAEAPGEEGSTRAVMEVTGICDGRRWQRASGRVEVFAAGDLRRLRAGEPIQAAGALAEVPGPLNPGEFDRRNAARARGIRLRLSVEGPEGIWADPDGRVWPGHRALGGARAWCRDRLMAGIESRLAPLAAALLLGRREEVDPDLNEAFARTGTTHLLAISGLHLQALAFALLLAFRIAGQRRGWSFVLVATATIGYALLVGPLPSVVRSAAMTVAVCLAALRNRCTRMSNLLPLAAIVTLCANPAHLFDVGCQLSFLGVAALAWGAPTVSHLLQRAGRPIRSTPWSSTTNPGGRRCCAWLGCIWSRG